MAQHLLVMKNISKSFPGVKALDNAYLDLEHGEVLGLLGENGAGKSTLMNVLGGIYSADTGEIYIEEQRVHITGVLDAHARGIGFIHQELALVPYLSVGENIFLGRARKVSGMVSKKATHEAALPYLEMVGMHNVDPGVALRSLSTGQQQMVEIAKALSLNAKILVMDEPSSSLSEKEVETMFNTVRALRKQGIGVIYISHKMEEIFELTDRVTVMRDGTYIGTKKTSETNTDELVNMMVGRSLEEYYVRTYNEPGKTMLRVSNISSGSKVKNCSFEVRQGEILGFYGLIGSGRSELMKSIMNLYPRDRGEIFIEDKSYRSLTPSKCQKLGLVLVPENRKSEGLILGNTVEFNITFAIMDEFISHLYVNRKKEDAISSKWIEEIDIKTPSSQQRVGNLSGGNQQKIVISKWLATNPKILILDEPTKGIDVSAKAEIYKIINDLAARNIAIIMISSELPEIINMCDRIAVMNDGNITAVLERGQFNQDLILSYALKGNK